MLKNDSLQSKVKKLEVENVKVNLSCSQSCMLVSGFLAVDNLAKN